MTDRVMQGTMPKRMIVLPALIPVIAVMAGCDDVGTKPVASEEWAAICVDPRGTADPADDVRLDDDACGDYDDDGDSSHVSYFFLWSSTADPRPVPAVGTPTRGYAPHRHFPSGVTTITKLPKEGAPKLKDAAKASTSVRRGGFGVPGAGKAGSKAGGDVGSKAGSKAGGSAGG